MSDVAKLSEAAELLADVERRPRRFSPYPKYCDSGVPWLGSVPAGWNVDRLKWTVTACQNGIWGDEPDGENNIACARVADFDRTTLRVNLDQPTLRAVTPNERRGRLLKRGDLLLEKSGGGELQPVGAVMLFDHDIDAVCSNFIARVAVAKGHDANFLTYLHAHLYSRRVNTRSIKQTTGIQNLDARQYLDELTATPPLDEQRAIAGFLDRETAKIDSLVAKKRRLIELLGEKRTALISHAVTKGLNPAAPTKPSGTDWLGDVPRHWELVRLRFVSDLQTGLTLGKEYGTAELTSRPYLRVANVQDGYLDLNTITSIQVPERETSRFELQVGDVLMTEGGDFDKLGRGYVWEGQIEGCLHQNHIFAVRPNRKRLDSHFLASVLVSAHGKNYFTSTSSQTTNLASTNSTKLRSLPVPLPPISEQTQIVAHLGRDSRRIDSVVRSVQKVIIALNEYRLALISAAVTGQIDVRAAAGEETAA